MRFLNNKYKKWYFKLMLKAEERILTVGEKHHIIPKSLGGSDDDGNIVLLSYREHFLAHWLLTKFTSGENQRKMMFALRQMQQKSSWKNNRCVSSWQYEVGRRAFISAVKEVKRSEETKSKVSNGLRGNKHSSETRLKQSISARKRLPVSEETKKKLSTIWTGRKHSVESRQKMSESRKGMKFSDEHKRNLSIAHRRV